jgi:hypothetical protein
MTRDTGQLGRAERQNGSRVGGERQRSVQGWHRRVAARMNGKVPLDTARSPSSSRSGSLSSKSSELTPRAACKVKPRSGPKRSAHSPSAVKPLETTRALMIARASDSGSSFMTAMSYQSSRSRNGQQTVPSNLLFPVYQYVANDVGWQRVGRPARASYFV